MKPPQSKMRLTASGRRVRRRDAAYRAELGEKARARRASDPQYLLRILLGNQLRKAVMSFKKGRVSSTIHKLVGCDAATLVAHLESKFTDETVWSRNLHIDHIRPTSSFNLLDENERKACYHYTNLQVLTARENGTKGSRWPIEK